MRLLNEIRQAERDYRMLKVDLSIKKADLWLNTEWSEIFKYDPSEKDKEEYCRFKLRVKIHDVEMALVNYNDLVRKYELKKGRS